MMSSNFTTSTPIPRNRLHLLNLPGEIRNQIYELCTQHSLDSLEGLIPRAAYRKWGLMVYVVPRWQGAARLTVEGMGSIRLLFVCKQIYEELSSFLISKTGRLCLGGYILQNLYENPTVRWQLIYDILAKRPAIQKFAKHVLVRLPSTHPELYQGYWRSIGYPRPPSTGKSTPWAVVPSLVDCLHSFPSLSRLEIEIVAQSKEVPDLRILLPLLDICDQTSFHFRPKGLRQEFYWEEDWRKAWGECLSEDGRAFVTR